MGETECVKERDGGKRERKEYVSCEEGKESECEGERECVSELEGAIYGGGLTGSVA